MKLLIISEGYYPANGGLEKLVTEVADGLNSTGKYDIYVITSTRDEKEYEETVHGISVVYLPLSVAHGKVRFATELVHARKRLKQILKGKYDFISIQYMGYLSAIFNSLRETTGYSVSIHGMDVTESKNRLIKIIQKKLIDKSSVIVSNSYYLADELEKKLNCDIQRKLKVIWNGIRLQDYEVTGMLTTDKVIVSVGRFVYKKGFDILIKAFTKVVEECPDAKLVLAGDGVERKKCEELAQKLGVSGRIEFLGAIPNKDIADVFTKGRIFVCPSRNEPFGIVVLEAMAMGIPVIVTDSGGVKEIVEDNCYGYIVPTEDSGKLAQSMTKLLQDYDKCLDLRKKGLERVQSFTIDNTVSEYDEIFVGNQ